jgi:hypothetical protein
MNQKIRRTLLPAKVYIPHLMLVLLLSSIAVASFHHHDANDVSDNCAICVFQHSISSVTLEPASSSVIFQELLSESVIAFNDNIADPAWKLVYFAHAPPQYS